MQNSLYQPCDICGDVGISEVIATCSECQKSREHIYCMHPNLSSIPESWCCKPCVCKYENCHESCITASPTHHKEEAQDSSIKEKVWDSGSESSKAPDSVLNVGSRSKLSTKRKHTDDFDAHLGYLRHVDLVVQQFYVDLKWKQNAVDFPFLNGSIVEESATDFNKIDDQEVDRDIDGGGKTKIETVDLCLKSIEGTENLEVDEINDLEVDMEIDMAGGVEVGIIDVSSRSNLKAEYSNILDIPSQKALIKVHLDQSAEENTVVMHLPQTIKQTSDVDAFVFSKAVASDVVNKGPIAESSMTIESDGNTLDTSGLLKSLVLTLGDSSSKDLGNGGVCISSAQPTKGVEEDGLACMVCRKGYFLRPNDMLGIYCFSQRVNLHPPTSVDSRSDFAYTTISHFNIIHFQCHREAKRADATLKNPRKEWKGAKFRNNGNLCNCIFPLKGPLVPMLQYERYVSEYWGNLNMLGKADGSRIQLLTQDIVQMLARFASGASFSMNGNCSRRGKESNSRFLPFMIQMALHLSSSTPRESIANSVSSYITATSAKSRSSISRMETIEHIMVKSVLSESYESWLSHRYAFLQQGIHIAYMRHMHRQPTFPMSSTLTPAVQTDRKNLFFIIQPMLVFIGLIEQLQKFFKPNNSSEGWDVIMKEKLVNMKEMLGFSDKLLLWLDNTTSAANFQGTFKAMGVISDVVPHRFPNCVDFVKDAIHAGKKEMEYGNGKGKRRKVNGNGKGKRRKVNFVKSHGRETSMGVISNIRR